jgi:hypothetical protein
VLALALLAVLLSVACRKSDAERAAAERAKLAERMRSSYTLTPYRLVKLAIRAQGTPDAPPELAAIDTQVERIAAAGRTGDAKGDAEAVVRLAALAWQARSLLARHDEDAFPLLAVRFAGAPPAPWYDAGSEHLALAFLACAAQLASRGGEDGTLLTFAAYELSRAEPSPAWPAPQRLVARFERGGLFAAQGLHYAADEELTAYLAELDEGSAQVLLQGIPEIDHPLLVLRGVGRLVRGWNRLQLDREELGLTDLDGGLRDLDGAGIENEATLWAWALVHARRGKSADAAAALERLAQSAYLDDAARGELGAAASTLRSSKELPGPLVKGRALVLVGRALVARAGGIEKIAAAVLGPERARALVAPLDALVSLQERVARAADPKRLAGQAKDAGGKLLDGLKARVGSAAEQQPEAQ